MSQHPVTMMTYIEEEPYIFKTVLSKYKETLKPFINFINQHSIKRCLILATGSSYNAALCAKYCFETKANILIDIQEPFNFSYYEKLDQQTDLVIAISQSGHSASTINALDKIRAANIPIFALTANDQSPICEKADYILNINCGVETVGFVTKGFLMTLLNLQLMALTLAKQNYSITATTFDNYLEELTKIGDYIPTIIARTLAFFSKHQQELSQYQRFVAIGYGSLFGVTKEFETKFTETVRVPSTGYELEAYMHGPYLEANKNHCLFFIENSKDNNPQYARSSCLKNYMQKYVGQVYTISTSKDEDSLQQHLNLNIPVDHDFATLVTVIPLQILAYHVATAKGIDLNLRIFDDFDKALKSKI